MTLSLDWSSTLSRGRRHFGSLALAVAFLCVSEHEALAEWPPLGRSICGGCTGSYFHRLASDGAGGVYVLWTDSRNYLTTDDDVFMQRILANGEVAPGWPATGLVVCDTTFVQRGLDLIEDGAGGAIAMWMDERDVPNGLAGSLRDIFAQRVRPDATIAPGWSPGGSPVTRAPLIQHPSGWPAMAPDGAGGALFVWEDDRNYPAQGEDVYMQRLNAIGSVAAGWPADGRVLSTAPEWQFQALIASDGAGGAFTAWRDFRNGGFSSGRGETFASHVLADGSDAPGWTPGGQRLHPQSSRPGGIVPDGLGGVYVVLAFPTADSQDESLFVAQRLTTSGAPAPGWPAEGITLCDAPGDYRNLGPSTTDGFGGLLTSWADGDGEVYVTRTLPDGSRPAGWPEGGLMVSSTAPSPYGEFDPTIAPDGLGGCYVAWERPTNAGRFCVVQHIIAGGAVAAGWPVGGLQLQTAHLSTGSPVMIADGLGGAILVYSSPAGTPFAQRFGHDGIVAATVSFVNADARSNEIELRWHVGGEIGFVAAVERRDGTLDEWISLGEVSADGTGAILYTDRAVEPGQRYAYRLKWSEHGAVRTTNEAWVETPALLRFALHGLQPNPSRGAAYAAFTLPSWAGGELELLDVTGRRIASREIGSLGPGRHVVRLDEHETVPPGLYLVRLRWNDREATARGVVMR